MYVKLIKRNYLISNNDNNNVLINSCKISKSNDVFQEIKKKEKIEVEKTQNYDKNNYSFFIKVIIFLFVKKNLLNMKLVLYSQIMEILIGKLMKHILKQIKLLKLYLMI
jgi:hypothetical protein